MAIREIKSSAAKKESIKKAKDIIKIQKKYVKQELKEIKKPSGKTESFTTGDMVRYEDLNMKGVVLSEPDSSERVRIEIGNKKIEVDIEKLKKIEKSDKDELIIIDQIPNVEIEEQIDLRGMDSIDAVQALEKYLDEAKIMNFSQIRIIHGKGEGILRKKVNEYLKNHPKIKSKRAAQWNEGGDGVTIVEI